MIENQSTSSVQGGPTTNVLLTSITLPRDLCITAVTSIQDFPKLYYGNKMRTYKLIVDVTIIVTNPEELESLTTWYFSELNHGTEAFKATLPILGYPQEYNCLLVEGSGTTFSGSTFPREYTFSMEILDDIDDDSLRNRLSIDVQVSGGDITFTTDGPVTVNWGDGRRIVYEAGTHTDTPFGSAKITSNDPVTSFSFLGNFIDRIVIDKALDLVDATGMCEDVDSMFEFVLSEAPNLSNTTSMFKGCLNLYQTPIFDMSNVTNATSMFESSGVLYSSILTTNVEIFDRMFAKCIDLECINQIDTRNQTLTTNMFLDTSALIRPDATEILIIEDGDIWVNDVACSDLMTSFMSYMDYNQTNIALEFTTLNGTDTTGNMLKAIIPGGSATSRALVPDNLAWKFTEIRTQEVAFESETLVDNISESTVADQLVTVPMLEVGDLFVIALEDDSLHELTVSVVEAGGYIDVSAITSGEIPLRAYNIGHIVEFDIGTGFQEAQNESNLYELNQAEIFLPEPADNSTINLKDFIDANNPQNAVAVTVTNNFIQPKIITGDLYGMDILFVNNGEIQGNDNSGTALELSSKLRLVNNGWIRGAGGRGGSGGSGGLGGHAGAGGKGGAGSNKNVQKYMGVFYDTDDTYWAVGKLGGAVDGMRISESATYCNKTYSCWYYQNTSGTSVTDGNNLYSKSTYITGNTDYDFYRVIWHNTILHTGGSGGSGGYGTTSGTNRGAGGAGGNGQQFNLAASGGASGGNGGSGWAYSGGNSGGNPYPSCAGNSGGDGGNSGYSGAGGRGGAGGSGGNWGTVGSTGSSGSSGTSGSSGSTGDSSSDGNSGLSGSAGGSASSPYGGSAGSAGGLSIQGTTHLLAGSIQGNLSGATE